MPITRYQYQEARQRLEQYSCIWNNLTTATENMHPETIEKLREVIADEVTFIHHNRKEVV